jgi:starch synthase
MASLLPLYIKEYYSDEPLFSESKIVTSVYNKDFEGTLNNDLAEKIKFDNISAEKIKVLEEPNYTNIIKSAVSNSDAIVQGSQEIPDEISEEIKNTDVPALSYQEEDSFESYLNFYKDLISEE